MIAFRLRYLGPVVLVALCLSALCAITAASLLSQQTTMTQLLRENVESRRVAAELEECLTDLIALENDRVEQVSVLHDRVETLLRTVRAIADQEEEKGWLTLMELGFADYSRQWREMPPLGHPGHEEARRKATRTLQSDVLVPCQEFKDYNAGRIEASAEHHETVLRRLAWGLGAVGALGAVAGVVLGYGVASSLARSLRQLRVQILDAVDKLELGPPEIVLTGQGDVQGLRADMEQLTGHIERVMSDLHQREREVLRAEQLAAVGQLAAGVAHEIRNPLTSIKMLVQAGLEGATPLDVEDLRVIESEVRRMEQSLRTFLDFARPPTPQKRLTELAPLIQSVVDLIHGRADKQRVTIDVRLDREESSAVIDAEQFRQVLVNLCLNALDAMPSGGTLTVLVRFVSADGAIEIEITDTGPGIPERILPQLFQPFASSKDTGLGLGLAICRRIMEDHGGQIVASNRPQGGARLLIHIPGEPVQSKEGSHAHAARG